VLKANEVRIDPNIVAGTFRLNGHYVGVPFDSGVDYSYVSFSFVPLLGIKLITMVDGEKVKLNRVVCVCTLVRNECPFFIAWVSFDLGSFDVVVGMDWMSLGDAVIVSGDEVVQIPLSNGEVLRIRGEQCEAFMECLMSVACGEASGSCVLSFVTFRMFPGELLGLSSSRPLDFSY
jgi:hypothetical protein